MPPSIPSRTGQGFWHTRNKRANAEALARNFKAAVVERQKRYLPNSISLHVWTSCSCDFVSLTNWRKEEGSRGAGLTEVNSTVAFSPWFHGMLKRSKAEVRNSIMAHLAYELVIFKDLSVSSDIFFCCRQCYKTDLQEHSLFEQVSHGRHTMLPLVFARSGRAICVMKIWLFHICLLGTTDASPPR